jgi:hypothetical protein
LLRLGGSRLNEVSSADEAFRAKYSKELGHFLTLLLKDEEERPDWF